MRSVPAWRFLLPVCLAGFGILVSDAVVSQGPVSVADRAVARGGAPAAGKFLVARREMLDPNFAKTVVLLLDYGADGAVGVTINRPSHVELSTLSDEIEGLAASTAPLYVGGPVPAESMFVLFLADDAPEDSERVFGRVHVTRSADVLRDLVDSDEPADYRVIAGYSGWAPGQLDNELARGDWHVVEADEGSVFSDRPAEVWELAMPPEPTRQALRRSTKGIGGELEPLEPVRMLAALHSVPVAREGARQDAEADESVVVLVAQFDQGRRRTL